MPAACPPCDVQTTIRHPARGRRIKMRVELRPTDDDDQVTAHTIERMREYVIQDAGNEIVRRAAHEAIRRYPDRHPLEAVFEWVRRHLALVDDAELARPLRGVPDDSEILIRPVDILTMPQPQGDCDDYAMLTAAMLRALGVPASFRTVAAEGPGSDRYSHVYPVAHWAGKEVPIDASHGPRVGWEVTPTGKTHTWAIEDHMNRKRTTLGALPTWATDLFKIGAETGARIAKERYAVPPPGTYWERPGEVIFRQPVGAPAYTFPGAGATLDLGQRGGTTLIIIAGVVLLGILILKKK